MKFTVSRDGTIDRVAMKDEVTRVKILKIDAKTIGISTGRQFFMERVGLSRFQLPYDLIGPDAGDPVLHHIFLPVQNLHHCAHR